MRNHQSAIITGNRKKAREMKRLSSLHNKDHEGGVMKKYGFLMLGAVAALSILLTGSLVMAAEKIAFVNVREALINTEAGKIALAQVTKIVEKDRDSLQAKEKELQKLKDEIEKQRQVLKEETLKAKELDYQKKLRDYQLMVRDANEEVQAKEQEVFRPLYPVLINVLRVIGEREQYTMIVDVSTTPLAFYDRKQDISKKVIDEFNKTYKK
jgi:outer membrane protein